MYLARQLSAALVGGYFNCPGKTQFLFWIAFSKLP